MLNRSQVTVDTPPPAHSRSLAAVRDADCQANAQVLGQRAGAGRALRQALVALGRRCETFASTAPLRFSLLVVGALLGLTLTVLSPSFQTNDDPQLAMIAAGKGMCLAPDEHLIFTNVVIGHALKALYIAWPSIPWYGGYLLLAQYLALAAILYCAIERGYTRWRLALYGLFFAAVGIFYVNNLQFTTTAALVGQAGILLCLAAFRRPIFQRRAGIAALDGGGVALVVLASLIRLESACVSLLIAVPAAAWALGWPLPKRSIACALAVGGICSALIFAFAAYDGAYYARDPQWSAFLRYNKLRVKFNDYGWTQFTPETAGIFAAVGWTENDHALIADWFYDNSQVYSERNLRQLLDSYRWRARRNTPAHFGNCARSILRDKSLWPGLLFAPLLLWCAVRQRRTALAVVCTAFMCGLLLVCVAVFKKPPPSRVYFPVLTFPLALLLLMARRQIAWPRRRLAALTLRCLVSPACWSRPAARVLLHPTFANALMVLALVGVGMAGTKQYRHSYKMALVRRDALACLARLDSGDDRLYVSWPTDFPYDAISPLDDLNALSKLHLLFVSWSQRTPISKAMKRKFDLPDVLRALYGREDVLLLGDATARPLCRQYIREHYGDEVQFVSHFDGGHGFDVTGRFAASGTRQASTNPPEPPQAPRR